MAGTLGSQVGRGNSPCGLCTRRAQLHRAPDRDVGSQTADLYRGTGVRCLDDEIVTDRHLYVTCVGKDQIARSYLGGGDRQPVVDLVIGGPVQLDSGLGVGPLNQT